MKKKTNKPGAPEVPVVKGTTINGCNFSAVRWDAAALKTVQTVAEALKNLTDLFKSQNVTVKTMIQVGASAEDLRITNNVMSDATTAFKLDA